MRILNIPEREAIWLKYPRGNRIRDSRYIAEEDMLKAQQSVTAWEMVDWVAAKTKDFTNGCSVGEIRESAIHGKVACEIALYLLSLGIPRPEEAA